IGGAADNPDAVAVGVQAHATVYGSVALGRVTKASSQFSIAVGSNASVDTGSNNSIAMGASASVAKNAANAVALASTSIDDTANTISVGSSTLQRKIVNVADGALSSTSTDAVTGKQLYATNQDVATNKTNITSLSDQITSGSVGLVKQDATSQAITV